MPAKAKKESNVPLEQLSRRRSARLAGLDKDKPAESQKSKVAKKEPAKKKSKKVSNDKMSKGDVEVDSSVEKLIHNDKLDNSTEDSKNLESNEKEKEEISKKVVKPLELPSLGSNEIKDDLKAQGEDGELLGNFVQATRDDVPDVKVVPATINGICTTNNLDTDKTEEPQLQVEEPKASSA